MFTVIWSGVVTFIIFKIIEATIGLRLRLEQERQGCDTVEHGERGYER